MDSFLFELVIKKDFPPFPIIFFLSKSTSFFSFSIHLNSIRVFSESGRKRKNWTLLWPFISSHSHENVQVVLVTFSPMLSPTRGILMIWFYNESMHATWNPWFGKRIIRGKLNQKLVYFSHDKAYCAAAGFIVIEFYKKTWAHKHWVQSSTEAL